LARGERSSPERTREDRERARAERERRRAERAGEPLPETPPALESDPDVAPALPAEPPAVEVEPPEAGPHDAAPEPEAAAADDLDPEALPIAPPEPADPPDLPVHPTTAPDLLEAEPGHAPAVPPEAMTPPPVEFEPEAYSPQEEAAPEPAAAAAPPEPEEPEVPSAPAESEPPVVPAEPEAAAMDDLDPEALPIAPPEPADPPHLPVEPTMAPDLLEAEPGHAPAVPPEAMSPPPVEFEAEAFAEHEGVAGEPVGTEPYAAAVPEQSEVAAAPVEPELPVAPVEPDASLDPAEPAHDNEPDEAGPGYVIPGLPEAEGPQPREGLPEPPRRMRGAQGEPMRRAFRRGEDGTAAAGLASEGRSAGGVRGRDGRSRWIALVALLVIGIVVAVLVYSLKHSSSNHSAAKAPAEVKVLIPEGKTRLQIAQIASAAGLTGSYRRAARSSPLLNPAQYGAPKTTKTLEGFLFPATYDMDKGAPSQRLVEEQVTAFQENFSAEDAKRAKELGLTSYELLTVASMIEREAQVPSDRAKIAAVIYNRLKAGIPIGIDAAIYYAVENADNIPTYTKELTASQLAMNSPYNTRLHKGLPPTPISNPGVASIQAAAHPAHASYLYYVAGADGCGEQVFSTTEAKFNEDVAAYEAAKRANGGHLPACKHH
jgi:UPF0755 protein